MLNSAAMTQMLKLVRNHSVGRAANSKETEAGVPDNDTRANNEVDRQSVQIVQNIATLLKANGFCSQPDIVHAILEYLGEVLRSTYASGMIFPSLPALYE